MSSVLPTGRLAERLYSLTRERAWFSVLVAVAGIAWVDFRYPAIGLAPLYLPVVCVASWSLGGRSSYLIAFVVAILAVVPSISHDVDLPTLVLAAKATVRVICFVTVAAAINSFRRSYQRERYHAHRDRMTGTLNKQVFHSRAAKVIEEAGRSRMTLLLVMLDLDDFKAINSKHGHGAGDEVLRTFADSASSIMRREDLLGRIGGDEFGLLIRVPSIAEGHGFANDVHARLSAVLVEARYPVTYSMGALIVPPSAPRDLTELMHAADLAMYQAKHTGKNGVSIARADDPMLELPSHSPAQLRHQTI